MATRKEKLEVGIVATDAASNVIKDVAKEADKLDGTTADVTITAEDRATADVKALMGRIDSLTDDEKKVILTAEARKLESEVKRATELLGTVEGETFTAVLDAKNQASSKLDRVQDQLATLDRTTADATLEATDRATGDINRVDSKLDTFDRRTVDADVDVTVGSGLSGMFDDIDGIPTTLGGIAPALAAVSGPGGAAALVVGSLVGIATQAGETATDVSTIATMTGSSTEEASGLYAVWKDKVTGSVGDLLDVLAQVNGVMRTSPGIAAQLGVEYDANRTPLETFIALVDGLNASQLTASERLSLMSQLFGEEGARQVASLLASIGPGSSLRTAIDDVADTRILSQEDIDAAVEFNAQWAETKGLVEGLVNQIGGPLLENLSAAVGLLNGIAGYDLGSGQGTLLEFLQDWTLINKLKEGAVAIDEMVNPEVTGEWSPEAIAQIEAYQSSEEKATEAVAELNAEIDAQVEAVEAQTAALEESIDKLNEMAEAQQGTADAYLDTREAERDAKDALDDYSQVLEEQPDNLRAQERALDGVIRASQALADAKVEEKRTQFAAQGMTLSATAALDMQNHTLLAQAQNLTGPLRAAMVLHIAQLNQIPPSVQSEIQLLIDQGKVSAAERLLNQTSRTRESLVQAGIDQASVNATEAKLAWLARQRAAAIVARYGGIGEYGYYAYASGTPSARRGVALVGEHGPELVEMAGGEKVHTANATSSMMNGNGNGWAGAGTTVHIYPPAGTVDRDIVNAVRRYARIQGS